MADQKAQKEPSIEEMMAATHEPTIEDMMAASKGEEAPASAEFTPAEYLTRTAREAAAGATLEASERLFFEPVTAAYKLLSEGKVDEAKSVLQNYDIYRDKEWARQEQFEKENKMLATTAGLVGGLAGPSAKLAQAGLTESTKFLGRMGQAAVTGAVASGATEAAKILGEPEKPGLADTAKRVGMATGAGAIAGPVIGAGMEGVAKGIGKVMTSGPAMRMVQVIAGPPVKAQKAYLEAIPQIEALPDEASVIKTFGEIRDRVIDFAETNAQAKKQAQEQVALLEAGIKEKSKEAKGEVRSRLLEAERELSGIKQQLQLMAIPQAKTNVAMATAAQKAERAAAIAPEPLRQEVSAVNSAIDEFKNKYIEKAATATNLISDEIWFERQLVIDAYKKQIQDLKKAGAPFGKEARNTVDQLERELVDLSKELPDRLTGQQVKEALKQLDLSFVNLQSGQFGDKYGNAIKGIRYDLDKALKKENPDYEEAMKAVAADAEQLAKVQQFFIGSNDASTSDKIITRYKQAEKDPQIYGMLEDLEKATGINLTDPVNKLRQQKELAKTPLPPVPQQKELDDLNLMVSLAQAKKFDDAVFASIADKQMAQTIVNLKRQIDVYRDPKFVESQIQQAVASGQMDLATAQGILKSHEAAREKMGKAITEIARKGIAKPEDILMTILKAPDAKAEQAAATRMIDALASLPDDAFKDLFEALTLRNPSEIANLAKNLRVRESLDRPRTNGSRRAVTIGGFFKGLVDKTSNEPITKLVSSSLSAFGPVAGAYLDEFGGAVARAYLRNAARLQGIPTGPKFRSFATAPLTAKIRNTIATQMSEMAAGVDPEQLYGIAQDAKPAVERDIKQSKMSAIERAKALNELNSMGGISGTYVRKIMLESRPPASIQPISEAVDELEADKPDMAQRLSKRTLKAEEKGLQGIVSRMREA